MSTLLDILRDKQFRSDVADNAGNLAQAASNSIAGNIGVPVDALAWLLRKGGLPVPSNPVGGTDWMAQKGLTREVPEGAPKMAGETLGALAPFAFAKPAVNAAAAGMNQLEANLAAPATMNKQAGAISLPGGGLSVSRDDAAKLAESIKSMGKQYIPKIEEANGGSVYLTVQKAPLTKAGEIAKNRNAIDTGFKARFADHPSYWGNTISSDPVTQNTLADVLRAFEINQGQAPKIGDKLTAARFNPADKYGTIDEKIFQDAVSLKGNPIQKWITESRPFTFYEPK